MGFYINVPNEDKEDWLDENAVRQPLPPKISDYKPLLENGLMYVCLVQNPFSFSAAAVAITERELEVFLNPADNREKKWYRVNINDAIKYSDLEASDVARIMKDNDVKFQTESIGDKWWKIF